MHFGEVGAEVNALFARAALYLRVGSPFCDIARACILDLYGHLVCIIRTSSVLSPFSELLGPPELPFCSSLSAFAYTLVEKVNPAAAVPAALLSMIDYIWI